MTAGGESARQTGASPARALQAALEHHQAGRLARAEALYRQVLDADAGNVEALHLLGVAAHQAGRDQEAATHLERATALAADPRPFANNLGEVYRALGRHDAAIASYRQALELDPDDAAAHNNLGLALTATGDAGAAIASFRRALALDEADNEARWNLADALLENGATAEALGEYQRLADANPRWSALFARIGAALLAHGAVEDAVAAYRHAVNLSPPPADLQLGLGEAHARAGRAAEAIACLEEALRLDPGSTRAALALAAAREGRGLTDEAARSYRAALALDPGLAAARLGLARCLTELGDHEAAIAGLESLLADAPSDLAVHLALGEALHRAGRDGDAAEQARDALALDATSAPAHRLLGHALFELGELEAASRSFYAPARRDHALDAPVATTNVWRTQVTRTKLRHDVEQLRRLGGPDRTAAAELAAALAAHERALRGVPERSPSGHLFSVAPDSPLAPHYNRLFNDAPAPRVPAGALHPALDTAAIEADFRGRDPGCTWFDGLLGDEALAGLQRYAAEASIWLETKFESEVGASLASGFACPLLLQIAAEVRAAFPAVFGGLALADVFAYKYYQDGTDGHVHADIGAASVNFWITPDTASLDPHGGGLVIWNKKVPPGYFRAAPPEKDAIEQRLIAEPDAVATRIPYRCNRAMLFHSSVLHKSDAMRFRDDHDARRVSVTMVFGRPA